MYNQNTFKKIAPKSNALIFIDVRDKPFDCGAIFIMEEIWKEIIGFEKYYKISNTGKILSLRTNKIVKQSKNLKGYLIFLLKGDFRTKQCIRIHRQVAIHFIQNTDNLPQVNHKDMDKENNNDWNLEWCTNKENALHSWENGRTALKAHEVYNAKFTKEQIIQIRNLLEDKNLTHKEIAQRFNCARCTITAINTKRSYKY